nr:hypothetical protein Iba_chr15cCG4010 [Ipomoea batatas]
MRAAQLSAGKLEAEVPVPEPEKGLSRCSSPFHDEDPITSRFSVGERPTHPPSSPAETKEVGVSQRSLIPPPRPPSSFFSARDKERSSPTETNEEGGEENAECDGDDEWQPVYCCTSDRKFVRLALRRVVGAFLEALDRRLTARFATPLLGLIDSPALGFRGGLGMI